MNPPDHPELREKAIRLAGAAFYAGLQKDWRKASAAVQRIGDECGGAYVVAAMIAWCDTYIEHALNGDWAAARRTDPASIDLIDALDHPAGVLTPPVEVVWAAKLVLARAAMDQQRFDELLGELPADGVTMGRHVGWVLQGIVLVITALPRGFALPAAEGR